MTTAINPLGRAWPGSGWKFGAPAPASRARPSSGRKFGPLAGLA